jgi:hypothetical protein
MTGKCRHGTRCPSAARSGRLRRVIGMAARHPLNSGVDPDFLIAPFPRVDSRDRDRRPRAAWTIEASEIIGLLPITNVICLLNFPSIKKAAASPPSPDLSELIAVSAAHNLDIALPPRAQRQLLNFWCDISSSKHGMISNPLIRCVARYWERTK